MPHADPALRLLALTALSLAPAWAHALCQPMAATGQRETIVTNVKLSETNTLLALDGSRIRSWEAPVDVETGPRATPVIWAERVDWSVYAAEPDARIGPTVLRFERGADGVRHLCGIAEYDARTLDDAQASRQKTLPKPDNETRFQYDDTARLIGVELRSYAASGKPNASLYTCLRYDRSGWLAERSANACSEASQPLARYVHDAAGRLLRTIAYVERQGDAREVTTFDVQGKPAQRYERQRLGWENEQLALGLPYQVRPSEFAVLVLPGPNWAAPALRSYHYDWAIVHPQDGDVYAAKRNPAAVLASGNSGNNGQFTLSLAQRQRVWEAAGQTPGSVQWLWAPGQIYTLLQTVPKATWAACTDPENRQPDACESR
ncbi:hypothetical protein [Achromobacter kerstersii]